LPIFDERDEGVIVSQMFKVRRRNFGFLQADNVGVLVVKKIPKAFFDAGANAINIPGDEFDFFGHELFSFMDPLNGHAHIPDLA
jgi:hypothetical protein